MYVEIIGTPARGRIVKTSFAFLLEKGRYFRGYDPPPISPSSHESTGRVSSAEVRSEEEASRLRLDLCGAVIRGGVMSPLLDIEEDLGIQIHVVPDDAAEPSGLARAFDGADVAVLLSAAHADLAPEAAFILTPS